jgi:peptide-methionine (R)-S-oxide reductase
VVVEQIVSKTDDEWKKQLTPEQYEVCRRKGTELPFSGEYFNSKEKGIYRCVCCGNELFSSDNKFDSGTGWPSFTQPIKAENVEKKLDLSYGMIRKEVKYIFCLTIDKKDNHNSILSHDTVVFNRRTHKFKKQLCLK